MSNFFMVSMAAVTRAAFSAPGSLIMSKNTLGTTCQCRPYLSATQPQAISCPPSASRSQY
jgi:hypothetical protein